MKKENNNFKRIVTISLIVLFAISLVFFLVKQIKYLIYQERKELLNQLINTTASTVNENIDAQWRLVDFYANTIEKDFNEDQDVMEYLNRFSKNSDSYFLVDSNGKYYCSDGHMGKIIDNEYYYDNQEKVEYLGSLPHLDNSSQLIFRKALSKPLKANFNGNEIEIVFCGSVHSLEDLNNTVSNLFLKNNNTIIFDTNTGVMLYRQFNLGLLIDGYNVYPKYTNGKLLYNETAENIINEIKNSESTVCLMNISDRNVYICTSEITVSNWALLMVVDTEFFDLNSNNSITSIIATISIIIALLAVVVIFAYTISIRIKIEKQRLIEQENVSQALQAAYETKSSFLSYMSHDIRTPINGIIGMSSIGMNVEGNSDKTNECFKKIDTASKHLLSLVNDVLDMSALESNKIAIKKDSFNIRNLLNSCIDIINGQLVNREIRFENDFALPYEKLIGDELHIKQVLINILGNALKFTNDGGRITFIVRPLTLDNNTISYQIEVEDTGIGMDENTLNHLFDAFVQGNKNRVYKGSGLGMAISQRFIQMMGGDIKVESKLDIGTKVIITIPLQIDTNTNKDDIDGLNILLVEDNELNIEIARELLISKGVNVTIAKDGVEAIKTYEDSKINEFDVILMDIMMPRLNGLDATKAIRKSARTDHNLPIIALSANSFKDEIDKMMEAGMNDHISKPIDIDKLVNIIVKARKQNENNK